MLHFARQNVVYIEGEIWVWHICEGQFFADKAVEKLLGTEKWVLVSQNLEFRTQNLEGFFYERGIQQ